MAPILTFASPSARVLFAKGEVSFNGSTIEKNAKLTLPGTLKTGKDGVVKVEISSWRTNVALAPGGEIELKLKQESPEVNLLQGTMRWISRKVRNKLVPDDSVVTKVASIGVRGTDYLLIANPLLGETEIVVIDGKVEFKSKIESSDKASIGANQWGGLGGRFGQKIGKILTLPKNVMDYFDSVLKI